MKRIDARGMQCPQPVIEAKKALKDMKDEWLEILTDNEIAVKNLTKMASYLNLETRYQQVDPRCFCVEIKAGNPSEEALGVMWEPAAETAGKPEGKPAERNTAVVIAADHMGEGDEVLGRLLLKGFLYALTELEDYPKTLIFYNSGAYMTVSGSDSLEDLKKLEAEGVEILTCGTCLKHYGLGDKLAVGGVTDMYTITETLTAATTVIRP